MFSAFRFNLCFKLLRSFFSVFLSFAVSLEFPSFFSKFAILFSKPLYTPADSSSALLSPCLTPLLFSLPDTYLFLNVVLTFDGTFLYISFAIIVLNSAPRFFMSSLTRVLILASPFLMLYEFMFFRASSLISFK